MDLKKLKELGVYRVKIKPEEIIIMTKDCRNPNFEEIIREVWTMGYIKHIDEYKVDEGKIIYHVTAYSEGFYDFAHNSLIEDCKLLVQIEAHLLYKEVWEIYFPPIGKGAIALFDLMLD